MALPVSPGPRSADVAVTGYAAITVRVAWTLLCEGIRVRPAVLRDARDHVLYHLEPGISPAQAEDRAERLTRHFVARARRQRLDDPWPTDAAMPLSPRWRRTLEHSLTPLTMAVFRQHYGDARALDDLERTLQVDRVALEGARGGLREVVRQAACADGLPVDDWPPERLDGLLRRLAAFAPDPCPPRPEVLDGQHRAHVIGCARCTRTMRLLKTNVLQEADLQPPLGRARPSHHATVLALHFHPDGRHHRRTLGREADVPRMPIGEDLLLLDYSEPEPVDELLTLATEVSAPARDHLRGVVLCAPGRWSRHGLLGPLAEEAEHAVRSRPWGTVDALGELPGALPEPPSARRLWLGVAVLAALAALSVRAAWPAPPPGETGLAVEFSPGRGGMWSDFDVPESDLVTLVRESDGHLKVVLRSTSPADKAALATGDGSYRLHTMGPGVLVAATRSPLPALAPMAAAADAAPDPLQDLAERIRQADPRAEVQTGHR